MAENIILEFACLISLRADDGVLSEPIECCHQKKDHKEGCIPVQAQIEAQACVPVQQIYQIDRENTHTQSDFTLPDNTRVTSSLKRLRCEGKARQAKSLEETVVIDQLTNRGEKFLICDNF